MESVKEQIVTAIIVDKNVHRKSLRCENCESPYFLADMEYYGNQTRNSIKEVDYTCAVCKQFIIEKLNQ